MMKFFRRRPNPELPPIPAPDSAKPLPAEWAMVAESGLLDATYYLEQYPDVARSGIDALTHYCSHGAVELRNPSARFNASYYASLVGEAHFNPVLHYLLGGRALGLRTAPKTPPDAYDEIVTSGLFDLKYYLDRYKDVQRNKVDPLRHFIRHGAKEFRQPNALFDVRYYCTQANIDPREENPLLHYLSHGEPEGLSPHPLFAPTKYLLRHLDVVKAGMSPLAHYLKHGLREGRQIEPNTKPTSIKLELPDIRSLKVSIIIPVFNGGEHVQRCIESVLEWTTLPGSEVIIINDASTDRHTNEILSVFKSQRHPGVHIHSNPTNLGFTKTVNRGFSLSGTSDVVILNSDTMVSPRWLENLAIACYRNQRTATATALSNSAGAFSTPAPGHNELTSDVATIARLSRRATEQISATTPTGHGFCMFIRRAALDELSGFDATHFPKGYGEENDFCLRAIECGWEHAVALKSYVYHVNAVSFGGEKSERVAAARRTLDALHPGYGEILRTQLQLVPLEEQRPRLQQLLHQCPSPLPRILFVVSTRTGGTPQTNADLMRAVSDLYEPFLLTTDRASVSISRLENGSLHLIATHPLTERVSFSTHGSQEYEQILGQWLLEFDIELVHIRHIAWHSVQLPRIAQRLAIPVVKSFHDFYCVCPSVNLTDGEAPWDPAGFQGTEVVAPLWPDDVSTLAPGTTAAIHLTAWQRRMRVMIGQCDALVTTDRSAQEVLARAFDIEPTRIAVIPHGRDFDEFGRAATRPIANERLRVLVPGNINKSKGLDVLERLAESAGDLVELHVLGTVPEGHLKSAIQHGGYSRDMFGKLAAHLQPHLAVVLSIWPETYCHTLTECWAAGIPVAGTAIGAVGARLKDSEAGWTVAPTKAEPLVALLRELRADPSRWDAAMSKVVQWQETVGRSRTTAAMSDDYLRVYSSVLSQRKLEKHPGAVAVIAHGHFPSSPPSVHVRLGRLKYSTTNRFRWVTADEALRIGISEFPGILLCRNVLMSSQATRLVRQHAYGGRVIVDLDDDLLNVPNEKDTFGEHRDAREALAAVLSVADGLTTSTVPLAERLRSIAREEAVQAVLPNRLDSAVWGGSVQPLPPPRELLPGDRFRIFYMGSNTHAEDFNLVRSSLLDVCRLHGGSTYLVGVGDVEGNDFIRLRPPSGRYDRFIPWIRSLGAHFDLAIAPLVASEFNSTKSPLKFMEYGALGLPTVCSRVVPYSQYVNDGIDGLLADNDPGSWLRALRRLVESADERKRIASAVRIRAAQEFLSTKCEHDALFASQAYKP